MNINWRRPHAEKKPEIAEDLLQFANYDVGYAVWLSKLNSLCERLINIELLHLLADDRGDSMDTWDGWQHGVSPERYFVDVVVCYVEYEQGADFIDEVIGVEAMWGASHP